MANLNFKATLLILMTIFQAHGDSFTLKYDGHKIEITTRDLEMLPCHEIETTTNFTPSAVFTGVRISDLLNKNKLSVSYLRIYSLDEYSYTVPIKDLDKYNMILAYKKNGAYISVTDLGPFAIIYQRDSIPEKEWPDINAKTVWQISEIEAFK